MQATIEKLPGPYLSDGERLFHVEYMGHGEILLEDCRTGELVVQSLRDFARMKLTKVEPEVTNAQ